MRAHFFFVILTAWFITGAMASEEVSDDVQEESITVDPSEPIAADASPDVAEERSTSIGEPSTLDDSSGDLQYTQDEEPSKKLAQLLLQPELNLLGAKIEPGSAKVVSWAFETTFADISVPVPVLVVNGTKPGPTICLTAAVHGDELNGIEIVRRVVHETRPNKLSGAIIGVPIVNLQGFQRATRYLPDRRDLNRYFPGRENGSYASRVAYNFFNQVITHCDHVIDIHTGSLSRTNLPQIRANLSDPATAALAKQMGSIVVLQSRGGLGTLRRAATDIGIPAVTLEAGAPNNLQKDAVEEGVKTVKSAIRSLGMADKPFWTRSAEPVFYRSKWIRARRGGILFSKVELGDNVEPDQVLGLLSDPITNKTTRIRSPLAGRVIGMALNQVMYPGFAAYHIGLKSSMVEAAQPDDLEEDNEDELEESAEQNTEDDIEIELHEDASSIQEQLSEDSDLIETTSTPIEKMELPTADSD